MYSEHEFIRHPVIRHINIFLVSMEYRMSHMHREIELDLILDGSLEVRHQSHRYTVPAGELVVFNSNQPHELRSPGPDALILCLQVSPGVWSDYYPAINTLVFDTNRVGAYLDGDAARQLKTCFLQLARAYYDREADNVFDCLRLLNAVMALLYRVPHHHLTAGEAAKDQRRIERLNRMLGYIDDNYMYNIRLGDLARREGLTESYLSHFFRENLNQSFQQYVSSLRLDKATRLVLSGPHKLLDICLECGYSDYRYVLKAFREAYGCTPDEYRTRYGHRGENRPVTPSGSHEYILPAERALPVIASLLSELPERG